MTNKIDTLWKLTSNEKLDVLDQLLPEMDMESIGEDILTESQTNPDATEESLRKFLEVTQYIETDTPMESVISDDLYDKLHARYVEITGSSIVGTNNTTNTAKPTKEHKYPELRGSLGKVHFMYKKDIPEKDSRKSLEDYFISVNKKCNLNERFRLVYGGLKYDGLSAVFECENDSIKDVLTRKDTDTNIGVLLNHIFKGKSLTQVFPDLVEFLDFAKDTDYGIKTEIYMTMSSYEEFVKIVPKAPTNRRSAVSMILNTSADEYNPKWYDYLTIQPLQASIDIEVPYDVREMDDIKDLCVINNRHQYMLNHQVTFCSGNIEYQLSCMGGSIKLINEYADLLEAPIDGVVLTILDTDVAYKLGRKNNINQFQIAYKFPAGIVKTKLLDVEFQVGPVAGSITPIAKIDPVTVMGNTIDSPSLSNLNKLKRLDLNIGDEVMIRYDIVPSLFKDETCHKGTGRHIDMITECPICGEPLAITNKGAQARCKNPVCPAKVSGKILNFVNKIKIPNLGLSTIETLVEKGFLNSPVDLYRLVSVAPELEKLPGFGKTSVLNLLDSIASKQKIYLHELLGAIGIPDIGRRVMKKIADANINLLDYYNEPTEIELRDSDELDMSWKLLQVPGIGNAMADKIIDGLDENRDLILGLLQFIDIKDYRETDEDTPKEVVLFTKIRDRDFAKFLEYSKQATVVDFYNKSVTTLIVPSITTESTKITKAIKDGKTIITLPDAYIRFGYVQ